MNKKGKNIELKIYELLGIKTFRKMAFGLLNIFLFPLTIGMSKEERKEFYNTLIVYNMKKGHGLQDLRDYKKVLLMFVLIHLHSLYNIMQSILNEVNPTSISTTIKIISAVIVDTYCLMLQRYNHIRINQVLKRAKLREEAKKSELKEELIKDNSSLSVTYKIVNKRKREKTITFEDLLETSNYEQLKIYRDYLSYFIKENQMIEENPDYYTSEYILTNFSHPLKKNAILKLEFEPKKPN